MILRPLLLLCAALPSFQDSGPADWIPADALLVIEAPAPAETIRHALDSEPWQRFWNGPLGRDVAARPETRAFFVGLDLLEGDAGAEPLEILESLTGGGLALALLPRGADTAAVLVARSLDAGLAQDGINTILKWTSQGELQVDGEHWRAPVKNGVLARRGEWFFFASTPALLERLLERPARPVSRETGFQAARREFAAADLRLWMGPPLLDYLRMQQPGEKLPDIGQSLFFGGLYAAYRQAEWLAAGVQVDRLGLTARAVGPADAGALRASHQVFFPAPRTVSVPRVPGFLASMLFARDLGPWWTSRDLYLSEKGMAASVEPDGNLSLLFQRDFGPEVLHRLEPEMRVLVVRAPFAGSAPRIEYPAGALGLRIKPEFREQLGAGFTSAFLATAAFINFNGNQSPDTALQLDLERLPDGSKLVHARYRDFAGAGAVPPQYNLSPGVLLRPAGEVWISSSTPLLRSIASAPAEEQRLAGDRLLLRMEAGREILLADRPVLLAQRALQEGGDTQAAGAWVDRILAGTRIIDQLALSSALDGDRYRLVFDARCDMPAGERGR